MNFDQEFEAFVQHHLSKRQGERYRRLKEEYGYGERLFVRNAYWPAAGNLDHLHPEFEIKGLRWKASVYR